MEAPALDPRPPPLVPAVSVRATRDPRRDAKQQAFEKAMQRRGGKHRPASDRQAPAAAPMEQAVNAQSGAANEARITRDDDGLIHIDVVV